MFTIPTKSDEFVIGTHKFSDLQINPAPEVDKNFYYFYDWRHRRLIRQFILDELEDRIYCCRVRLIKKGDKFTPRLAFSVRDKHGTIQTSSSSGPEGVSIRILRA